LDTTTPPRQGKAKASGANPASQQKLGDALKKGKMKQQKILHPKSRKALRLNRVLLRDDKIAGLKKGTKGVVLGRGERVAFVKEELVEDKPIYTHGEVLELIEKYINRFGEEQEAIELEDRARGRGGLSNPSRLAQIIRLREMETAEFVSGWMTPDLRLPKVVRAMHEWNYELNLIPSIQMGKFMKR
jgi:hypothetical protein